MPPVPIARYNVLGVGVSALTLADATALIVGARGGPPRGYVCFLGVHGISLAREDTSYRRVLNGSWINAPDGMPLVWIGRLQGRRPLSRVYGPDLMLAVCDAGRASGVRHYLYGGGPGTAERLRQRLVARYPGLEVVGTFTPPFRPLSGPESEALCADVQRTRPDVVWVGIGAPKQERFMAEFAPRLEVPVLAGVGAAFDFHAGLKVQAPQWIQHCGMEWAFRLATEPRRLAGRYARSIPPFIVRVVLQQLRLRKYPLE